MCNPSCNLNLDAQFNFKTRFIQKKVMQGEDGRKTNFSELDGIRIQLQSKNVSNAMLQENLANPKFLRCLKGILTSMLKEGLGNSPHFTPTQGDSTRESEGKHT